MFPFHKLLSSTLAGACRPIAAAFAVWPLFLILSQIVSAQKYSVLYTFQGESTGSTPVSGLVEDSAGNLYGTTEIGGNTSVFASGLGTVYKLTASGTETVLYNFSGGADGAYPFASVVRDSSGNLFGTTMGGGAGQCGTVFKLNPAGKETVLHSFDCMSQGAKPVSSLIMDPDGNLYGTTEVSGQSNPSGVVFKLDTSGNETVLHTFTGKADGELQSPISFGTQPAISTELPRMADPTDSEWYSNWMRMLMRPSCITLRKEQMVRGR